MFPLSERGRENLEAILGEFERASRYYPPLYHQILYPSTENVDTFITEEEWGAFIEAESPHVTGSEWWEWDGPNSGRVGPASLVLEMWFGNPCGQHEFFNLASAAVTVLRREGFTTADALDLKPESTDGFKFDFRSVEGWIQTLHYWAISYSMPLLRTEMSLWAADDPESVEFAGDPEFDDFYEKMERWSVLDGTRYPLHPLCWTLIDNMFTSSMAAIRAVLRPETVIATNEPWPAAECSVHNRGVRRSSDSSEQTCHRMVQGPHGWEIFPAHSETPIPIGAQSGMARLAALVLQPGVQITATELLQYGAKRRSSFGHRVDRGQIANERGVSESPGIERRTRQKATEDLDAVTRKLAELWECREEAARREDAQEVDRIDKTLKEMNKKYIISEGAATAQRTERSKEHKNAQDTVRKTIANAISNLKNKAPEIGHELEDQIDMTRFSYRPMPELARWEVEGEPARVV